LSQKNEEAINEQLEVEVGRFNQEFRGRLESLEKEFTSQQIKPLPAAKERAVQTDKNIPLNEVGYL